MSISQLNSQTVRKIGSEFSFISTFLNNVNNKDFLQNVNNESLSLDNNYTYIYNALSTIGNDVESKIYENILNYADNITDIDLCKCQALESYIDAYGIQFILLNKLHNIPQEIIDLIDIFSIRRDYLVNSKKFLPLFINALSSNAGEIDNNDLKYIDTDKFKTLLNAIYYNVLYDNLANIYYDKKHTKSIVLDIDNYNKYILNDHQFVVRDDDIISEINDLKLKYNINYVFNEETIVDNIENGLDDLDNYSINEQDILNKEIERRNSAYDSSENESRYYYYKEQHVQKYLNFIENYYNDLAKELNSTKEYDVDKDYIELAKTDDKDTLLYCLDNDNVEIRLSMISSVAQSLTDMTLKICEIRDQLKVQVQKFYMKGSFQLIQYTIMEHLRENIYPILTQYDKNINDFDTYQNDIDIVKYLDPTNYYNISTQYDVQLSINGTNQRYWEIKTSLSSVAANNTTDVFQVPKTIDSSNLAFEKTTLTKFYLDNLNAKFTLKLSDLYENKIDIHTGELRPFLIETSASQEKKLYNFLCSVFDSAADSSYIDISSRISSIGQDLNYKKQLFNFYGGNISSSTAYANYKNKSHPSYQVHPYLQNFIEAEEYNYPIENLMLLAAETMYELLKGSIDDYISNNGYLINLWKNPLNRNQDYLSRYEAETHIDSNNKENQLFCYDGLFYPQAIYEFITNSDQIIKNLNANIDTWYSGLNLSNIEKTRIANQLSSFTDLLQNCAGNKTTRYYDIYKYALDIYGNSYILLKDYKKTSISDLSKVSQDVKDSIAGILFVKYKNHPFALPAFYFDSPNSGYQHKFNNDKSQFYYQSDDVNNNRISYAEFFSSSDDVFSNYANVWCPKIYDFEIDESKTRLMIKFKFYKTSETKYVDTITIGSIQKTYNKNININRYLLTYDKIASSFEGNEIQTNENFIQFVQYGEYPGYLINIFNNNANQFKLYYFKDNSNENWVIEQSTPYTLTNYDTTKNSLRANFINSSNTIKLCYIRTFTNTTSMTNYLNATSKYDNLKNYLNTYTNCLDITEWYVNNNEIKQKINTENKCYIPYTDEGFIPVTHNIIPNTTLTDNTNNITNTGIESRFNKYKIVKCQLIGNQASQGIDYKQHLPIRVFEKYLWNKKQASYGSTTITNLYYIEYKHAHFYESKMIGDVGTEDIYSPYRLTQLLSENQNILIDSQLGLKIDECYINKFRSIDSTNEFLKYDKEYVQPWLLYGTIPAYYETPGKDMPSNKQAATANQYLFKFNDDEDEPVLSICWMKLSDKIKIDINSTYYNKQIASKFPNYYNMQHTFLNLDEPGVGGFLKTYNQNFFTHKDDDGLNFQDLFYSSNYINSVFYIKNISDDKPKLMIVKDWPKSENIISNTKYIDVIGEENYTLEINMASDNVGLEI